MNLNEVFMNFSRKEEHYFLSSVVAKGQAKEVFKVKLNKIKGARMDYKSLDDEECFILLHPQFKQHNVIKT